MQITHSNFSGYKTGNGFTSKARSILAEIYYALELSNRAYYQGVTRF
jgi:hypothetical protein